MKRAEDEGKSMQTNRQRAVIEELQKAQLCGNVVLTSQHPVLPYEQEEEKDSFQRGRTAKKNGRLSSSHGQALVSFAMLLPRLMF